VDFPSGSNYLGGDAGTWGGFINQIDATDFFLFWASFGDFQNLSIGDNVTISEGTRLVPNFLDSGNLPTAVRGHLEVYLVQGNTSDPFLPIASPVTISFVPEPSALVLTGVGLFGFLIRRGRKS